MSTTTNIAELRGKQHLAAKAFGENDLGKFIAAHEAQLRTVLPEHMDVKRLMRVVFNSVQATPQLLECTVESLIGATIKAAILGLEPNTPLGQAYLVPYWNGKKKVKEVQLIPGYKGLIDLARRSGQIVSIAAHEVKQHDEFEFEYGLDEKLVHKPAWRQARGETIGFYAVAHFKGGGHVFEVMSLAEVEAIRDQSQGYQAAKRNNFPTPWDDHSDQMGRKTAIRRLANYLPMSIEIADALALDNAAAAGKSQGLVLDGTFSVVDRESGGESQQPDDREPGPAPYREEGGKFINTHGEVWDPAEHVAGADGRPVVNQDGTFRSRPKRGPRKTQETSQDNSDANQQAAPQPQAGGGFDLD